MPRGVAIACKAHMGRSYASEAERAAAWGLSAQAIRKRVLRGQTLEQALAGPRRDRGQCRARPVTIDGVEYPSVSAAASAVGLSPAGLRWRLRGSAAARGRRRRTSPESLRWRRIERVLDAWRARRAREAAE